MSAATDILVYRTLASARGEGMPTPVAAQVQGRWSDPEVFLHLATAEDRQQWLDWFDGHGCEVWQTEEQVKHGSRFHFARSTWRGWQIVAVYLTPAEPAEGGEHGG